VKVAAIQFRPHFKYRKGNLTMMISLINQAADLGAKLVVLPELATTGYSIMNVEEAEPLSEVLTEFDPKNLKPLKTTLSSMDVFYVLAAKWNMHIVWGLVEKDQGTGNLYNTQVMLCPDGTFDFVRKINFFGNDFLWGTPGRANPPIRKIVVDGKEYKVGLLLCRDIRDKKNSDWKDFYEKGDADVVALSTNWGRGAFPATAWMEFVEENDTTLIVSNRYGKEANNDFGDGGICIIYPDARVQSEGLRWDQDCIVFGEV